LNPVKITPSVLSATQEIRLATRDLHAAVECSDIARELMGCNLTMERYAQILGVWARSWFQLEASVFSFRSSSKLGQLVPEERASKAKHDLEYLRSLLGPAMPVCSVDHIATAPSKYITLASEAEFLGHSYVMQGSALGGAVIARHLRNTLRLSPDRGTSFFTGAGSPLSWSQWCEEANKLLSSAADKHMAVSGATNAYYLILGAFSLKAQ
jgi:heme oxygenase (biliverdin-IX-beta and delta-forming)